jgi:hypothetical protein
MTRRVALAVGAGDAIASAKFGLRALAQSRARERGPRGVHVAHRVVNGGIDSAAIHARIKARTGKTPDELATDSLTSTNTAAYWPLCSQPRDSWTDDLDSRAYKDKW